MKIHCTIAEDGRLILSEREQSQLKMFAGENCVLDIHFDGTSDAVSVAKAQALDIEIVTLGLQQEGAWREKQK